MQKIARRKLAAHIASQLHAGANPRTIAQQTAAYLAEQKQTNQMELLIREIEAELAEQYDAVAVRVVSAHPLTAETRAAITACIKEAEGAQSVVITDETTDSALIGGAIVSTPSSTFDSSIRSQLQQLRATTKKKEL